jgi:hypothetical protein
MVYQGAGDVDACIAGRCAVQPFGLGEMEAKEPVAGHFACCDGRVWGKERSLKGVVLKWLEVLSREVSLVDAQARRDLFREQ